ncbi:MAG: 2OG-Fe(II) oxygenase family protein [Magnetospirillum sp.]|nr:2OG-Fe(II) oxygenase family protein [Magnetospirillum sp.]
MSSWSEGEGKPSIHWQRSPTRMALSPQMVLAACTAAEERGTATTATRLEMLFALVEAERFADAVAHGEPHPPGEISEWDLLLAQALTSLDRPQEALARIDASLQRRESHAARATRAELLLRLEHRDAAAAVDHVVANTSQTLTSDFLVNLLQRHGPAATLLLLEQNPSRFKFATWAESRLRCLIEMGRHAEAEALADASRYLWQGMIDPPPGFDRESFHQALLADIGQMRSLSPNPAGKATRKGMQTVCVLEGHPKAVPLLLTQLRKAVDDYVAALAGDTSLFARAMPDRAEMHCWTVLLERGGQQAAHIHPSGWLSGCYYVATPEDDDEGGCLNIPLAPPRQTPPWTPCRIRPEPGKLALFPSYFRHDTTPHQSDGKRICFAFDVVPV